VSPSNQGDGRLNQGFPEKQGARGGRRVNRLGDKTMRMFMRDEKDFSGRGGRKVCLL